MTHVPSFFCLKFYFLLVYFEIDLLTLKMTLNNQNNFRLCNAQSKLHEKEVLHMFLASFVKNSDFA